MWRPKSKIVSVQALRAVAALAILLRHVGFWEVEFFAAGVDLLFVISGFIMVVSCWREFGEDGGPRQFAGRKSFALSRFIGSQRFL